MQSPTPPTKPTPPTPPSMKTSTAVPSTDTHNPATTTPQPINASTAPPTSKEQSIPIPAVVPQSAKNISPQASYSTTDHTSTETTSETVTPSTTNLSKVTSPSIGFSAFFVFIFILSIAIIAVHWWKNHKPQQRPSVDYSTGSPDEIVNLILSDHVLEVTPPTPKMVAKKIIQPDQSPPKGKSQFEVRI